MKWRIERYYFILRFLVYKFLAELLTRNLNSQTFTNPLHLVGIKKLYFLVFYDSPKSENWYLTGNLVFNLGLLGSGPDSKKVPHINDKWTNELVLSLALYFLAM